jgi:HEPN domain-containing protein
VTRADWQQIAEERLLAAQVLLAAHNWPSAYYLAGYAIECGLKSCILARLTLAPELIFLEKRYSEKCWTHEIEELVKLAGLEAARTAAIKQIQPWGRIG